MYPIKSLPQQGFTHHKVPPPRGWRRLLYGKNRVLTIVGGVFLFGVLMIMLNIYQLRVLQYDRLLYHGAAVEGSLDRWDVRRPVLWVTGRRIESGYLKHVFAAFERVGYIRTNGGYDNSDWDVLWAHDYPFQQLQQHMLSLKPYQKVNHFPGSGYITNKVSLATSNITHVPRAFSIPKEKDKLEEYAKNHPETMWVQKSSNHRGIKIKSIAELDLTSKNTFVQEYIDKPFLIDGHRFDIGIYTTLTSIDPLRVYVQNDDWLIRFCSEVYYPFEKENIKKYVVTDDYKPVWEMPSLQDIYTKMDYSFKDSVLAYMRSKGLDTDRLIEDLHSAIREVYLDKEHFLITAATKYKTTRNFFEMVRFDFVLDEKLNVYLMEVNMSPNLSSGHFAANKRLYEQVVFSMLSLVGAARYTNNDFERSGVDEAEMMVAGKNIHVYDDKCYSDECTDNCRSPICKLCAECLKTQQTIEFKRTFLEHNNRQTWRRIFPVPFTSQAAAIQWDYRHDIGFQKLSTSNKWITLWFKGKCLKDATWCS